MRKSPARFAGQLYLASVGPSSLYRGKENGRLAPRQKQRPDARKIVKMSISGYHPPMKNRTCWSQKSAQIGTPSAERANFDANFALASRRAPFLASLFGAVLKVDPFVFSHEFVLTDDVNLRFLWPDDQKTKPNGTPKKNVTMLPLSRNRVGITRHEP